MGWKKVENHLSLESRIQKYIQVCLNFFIIFVNGMLRFLSPCFAEKLAGWSILFLFFLLIECADWILCFVRETIQPFETESTGLLSEKILSIDEGHTLLRTRGKTWELRWILSLV